MKPVSTSQAVPIYPDYDAVSVQDNSQFLDQTDHGRAHVWQDVADMLTHILPELSSMEANLDVYKEIFIQHIRAVMRALRIHDDTRVVIGLDEQGDLRIIYMEHEKAADLEAILTHDDDARSQLAAIALRTQMLNQISYLDETLNALMQEPVKAKSYHVCLKGDLSHFYAS